MVLHRGSESLEKGRVLFGVFNRIQRYLWFVEVVEGGIGGSCGSAVLLDLWDVLRELCVDTITES
jgi:hypothetical protein